MTLPDRAGPPPAHSDYGLNPPGGPSAGALLRALQAQEVSHVVTVPDFVQFALHERLRDPACSLKQVFCCSEDQALTTAGGLHVGGARPMLMMQNQGLAKCINTLRAVCLDGGAPLVMMVGQFGREPENFGRPTRESARTLVRITEPLLEALGVRYWNLAGDEGIACVAEAFAHAEAVRSAAVVLVDRHITWQ